MISLRQAAVIAIYLWQHVYVCTSNMMKLLHITAMWLKCTSVIVSLADGSVMVVHKIGHQGLLT